MECQILFPGEKNEICRLLNNLLTVLSIKNQTIFSIHTYTHKRTHASTHAHTHARTHTHTTWDDMRPLLALE